MKKIIAVLSIMFLLACLPLPTPDTSQTSENSTMDNEITGEVVKETTTLNETESSEKQEIMDENQENNPEEKTSTEDETSLEEKNTLPMKEVMEGELVSFPNLKATDPDGDTITYTFTEPLDAEGEWLTQIGDAGEYIITISANDGRNTATKKVKILVKPQNAAPIIEIDDAIELNEGEKIVLNPTVTDPDGDPITITYSGFMDTKEYQTNFDEVGSYKVTITATDGTNIAEKDIFVIIRNVNRPPKIDPIRDIKITEGDKIIVSPTGVDPDGDKIRYSFSQPLDEAGRWTSQIGDAGAHEITVTATDGEMESNIKFEIIVEALNKAPIIDINSKLTFEEGETVVLNPTISDAEGDEFTVSYSGWMNSAKKTTTYEDAGTYIVTITAEDTAGNIAKKDVEITIENVNRAPVFDPDSFI